MLTDKIFSAYVAYLNGNGGKNRPVLLLTSSQGKNYVFRLTSKFTNKSPQIKKKYFEIENWKESGLRKKSWIDTGSIIALNQEQYVLKPIGYLTENDFSRLEKFVENNDESN